MRKIKKIVDLSWEFTAETPIYPGDPEPSVTCLLYTSDAADE